MHPQVPEKYYQQESERLEFRELTESDVKKWLPFFKDTASLRFLGMGTDAFKDLSDWERAEKWIHRQIERKNNHQYGQLATIEKTTGKLIGVSGLILREEEDVHGEIEVTYSLLPEARGNGFATELAIHFKQWAFENTDRESVISIIHMENTASINVARKNGMLPDNALQFMGMPVHVFRVHREA